MMDFRIPKNYIYFEISQYQNIDFDKEADLLINILDNAKKENDIQRYIKEGSKWFIPASILCEYNLEIDSSFLIPEQSLGAEYRADYMLVGFNSIGPQIILVEFEDVNVPYKLSTSNTESSSVRKGITQIKDWKRWMDNNRIYFLQSCGLKANGVNVPSWGIHYCIVVSRRIFMNDLANAMRGQLQREFQGLNIISYDRIVDNVRKFTKLL